VELSRYSQLIEETLSEFSRTLPQSPEGLYEPMRYTLANGGKRMRPLLVLAGAGLFTRKVEPALPAALGIELFHNFTLLHDDIMDQAPLRRGKPSVYKNWNTNIAILSGDAMYTEAFRMLAQSPREVLREVLAIFTKASLEVCEGQQLDIDFESRGNVTIPGYLHMISLKTAVLLAAALEIGALCGGAPAEEAKKLYTFGLQVGIAFQLQDDILDVFAASEKFGKTAGGDIVANKKTFLLLKALELSDANTRLELQRWLAEPPSRAEEKVAAVKAIYDKLGIREAAEAEMWKHYNEGIAALGSVSAAAEGKMVLKQFADQLMVREH
jgi:geranylgeranyl diphosphate synthase type II